MTNEDYPKGAVGVIPSVACHHFAQHANRLRAGCVPIDLQQGTSRSYPLTGFADSEWSSEERSRYLAELQRDVDAARTRVDQLGHP